MDLISLLMERYFLTSSDSISKLSSFWADFGSFVDGSLIVKLAVFSILSIASLSLDGSPVMLVAALLLSVSIDALSRFASFCKLICVLIALSSYSRKEVSCRHEWIATKKFCK